MPFLVTLCLLVTTLHPALCNINNDLLKSLTTPPPKTYSVSHITQSPADGIEGLGCGWRQETGLSNRITGVTDAYFGEFPWVVAIFKYSAINNSYEYCCVGSLIHHKVVLTVNHYFIQPARIRIRAGDWDISKENEIQFHQSSDVTRVLSHPQYRTFKGIPAFDAALLLLSTPITVAPNVAFACLPPPDFVPPPGTRCVVAGWGQESFKNDTISNIMKMVELPVVDFGVCESQLRRVVKKRSIDLSPSMMCAGGEEGIDACLKDGGAPLVCPYSDLSSRYYQAGIVSWGVRCGEKDIPGVYTSVPKIREWIDETMKALSYDSVTYLP